MNAKDVASLFIRNVGPFEKTSIDLSDADVHLFLGPSGAGKTTILRSAAVPFGVRVAGLKTAAEMKELVRAGAGTGRIEIEMIDETGEVVPLAWSPDSKASPRTIRKFFGADPKDLEPLLVPGSLLNMTPDARRKLFARALGDSISEERLLAEGLTLDEMTPVREAAVLRGFDSAVRKSEEIRRAFQRERDALATGTPVDEEIDLGDAGKIRLSDLSETDLDELIGECDRAIVSAAASSASAEEALRQATDVAELRAREVEKAEDALNAMADDLGQVSAEDLLSQASEARRRADDEKATFETCETELRRLDREAGRLDDEIGAFDRRATLVRAGEETLPCDGCFAEHADPICPRPAADLVDDLVEKRRKLEAELAGVKASQKSVGRTHREISRTKDEAEREAERLADEHRAALRAEGAYQSAEEALAVAVTKAEEAAKVVERRQEGLEAADPDEGEAVDVDFVKARREDFRSLQADVRAFHRGRAAFAEKQPRRDALQKLIDAFERAEETLKRLRDASAGDPIDVAATKAREIEEAVLPDRLDIADDWTIWYGGRRASLASKGQRAAIDLALRAALAEIVGFPILLVDDLDAMDDGLRLAVVLDVLSGLRGRFAKILAACHAAEPEPHPEIRLSVPWLRRHFVRNGGVAHLDPEG